MRSVHGFTHFLHLEQCTLVSAHAAEVVSTQVENIKVHVALTVYSPFRRGYVDVDEEETPRDEEGKFPDSYLYVGNWGKGLAFVNGFNLGWYWPSQGPANTMCADLLSRSAYTLSGGALC